MIAGQERSVTGGVDTHGDVHVAAVLDSVTGRRLSTGEFSADSIRYRDLCSWFEGFGAVDAVGVESLVRMGLG